MMNDADIELAHAHAESDRIAASIKAGVCPHCDDDCEAFSWADRCWNCTDLLTEAGDVR